MGPEFQRSWGSLRCGDGDGVGCLSCSLAGTELGGAPPAGDSISPRRWQGEGAARTAFVKSAGERVCGGGCCVRCGLAGLLGLTAGEPGFGAFRLPAPAPIPAPATAMVA